MAALIEGRQKSLSSKYELKSLWGAGEWVVAEISMDLTFKVGPSMGKQLSSNALVFARLKAGKLSELYFLGNDAPGALALGFIKKKDFAADKKKLREWFMKKAVK